MCNLYGPGGLYLAVGKGILYTMHGSNDGIADIVPVDQLVNLLLAVCWKIGTTPK